MSATTTLAAPAAAAKLAADARAHGLTVTESATQASYEVYIAQEIAGRTYDATVVWSVTNIAGNCRLGFPTSYQRGVRLDYVSAHGRVAGGGYGYSSPKSIRGARYAVGLPI